MSNKDNIGRLHCEARRVYDEPADLLPYEDEIRSVQGPGCFVEPIPVRVGGVGTGNERDPKVF